MGSQGARAEHMLKEKAAAPGGVQLILRELVQVGIYKKSQGRITRQLTCLAIWLTFALGAWRLMESGWMNAPLKYAIPGVILAAGLWLGYRLVNLPTFADFLIAVEAEMNKVSWPSRTELVRSSTVVIIVIFGLTIVLFAYDSIWQALLKYVLQVVK